jgi:hypothetical protein
MDLFRTRTHAHLVPIHPKNAKSKDWVILLEASTIVGPSPDRLRVASTTQEKKVVWRFKSRWSQPFLVVDGYDPRIHVLYFCPQLYKFDGDNKLVPLLGEEIGKFVAQAVEGKVKSRRPWYEPLDELPEERIISVGEVDTLVVERPAGHAEVVSAAAGPRAAAESERSPPRSMSG